MGKPTEPEVWPSGEPAPRVRPARGGPPSVEIVSVGRELLHGWFPDQNGRAIAEILSARGARIGRITVVGDELTTIAAALREALERQPHLVITSGGLGPARDDRTLAAVAKTMGRTLNPHPEARAQVEQAYGRLAKSGAVPSSGLTAWREKLCRVPVGATPLANEEGLSPGVILRVAGGSALVCLPGRTHEMKPMLKAALEQLADIAPAWEVVRREIESPTADEAALREIVDRMADEFPELWITSHPSGSKRRGAKIFVTLQARAPRRPEAERQVNEAQRRLLAMVTGAY